MNKLQLLMNYQSHGVMIYLGCIMLTCMKHWRYRIWFTGYTHLDVSVKKTQETYSLML